jgi:hypothetical protein
MASARNSLRSLARAVRRMSPLLLVKIIVPFQNSEIALTTARFNVNPSVVAKWEPRLPPEGRSIFLVFASKAGHLFNFEQTVLSGHC